MINESLKWMREEIYDMLRLRDPETIEESAAKAQMLSKLAQRRSRY